MYIVPIIGTVAAIRRRSKAVWSFGDSIRSLFPDDRFYRKIRVWSERYRNWRTTRPVAQYLNLESLNLIAGQIEYAFGHLRDYTIGTYMMGAWVVDLTLMVFGDLHLRGPRFPTLFYHGFFALLSIWTYRRHVAAGLQLTEFMRVNPLVHPQEFFEHYYRRLGPSNIPVPTHAQRTVDPTNISYHTGKKSQQSYWLLLKGFYDTAIFARSAHKALDTIGREYGREVFDVMASLWGSRMLQLFRTSMSVEGVDTFHNLSGKIILVFNHKSHLDFVFNFFALKSTRLANGRGIRPRYMAAKDHFVDNTLVYSGLGVGKLIEANDMIFVDRKGLGKNAVFEACKKLGEKDIEIAMYPQGSRAVGNFGPNGESLDAGYYTTGSARSLKQPLGHLKKGCAFLAVDAVSALAVPVHLVFIGIDGTGDIVPKLSFKVQTEKSVKFTVGGVFTLTPEDIAGIERPSDEGPENAAQKKYADLVNRIQHEINRGLLHALGLHDKLKNRYFKDMRDMKLVAKERVMKITHRLNTLPRDEECLEFVIIDRIYALPWEEQSLLLKELGNRISDGIELESLRDLVTDRLFRRRGKEIQTIQQKEKAKKAV